MIFQRSPWDLGDPGNTNVKTGTLEAKLSHTEDIGAEDFRWFISSQVINPQVTSCPEPTSRETAAASLSFQELSSKGPPAHTWSRKDCFVDSEPASLEPGEAEGYET